MLGPPSGYEQWRESEAARLIATGRADTDTVRELLILACHASPLARRFFEDRLDSKAMLGVLVGLAVEDYSGDAQMTASYWVSRFPVGLLACHKTELGLMAANECESVSIHARRALNAIAGRGQNEPATAPNQAT